jgi:hypothetical protein
MSMQVWPKLKVMFMSKKAEKITSRTEQNSYAMTAVLNLWTANLSGTKAELVAKFAAGVVDTGGKFAAGVVDTGGNLPPVSLTPVAYLPPVVHLDLRISPRIFGKIRNDPNVVFKGLREGDS